VLLSHLAKPVTTIPIAMPEPEQGIERVKKPFDNYRIEYGITPENKDQTQTEFFSGKVKVGQALFGDGFAGVTGVGRVMRFSSGFQSHNSQAFLAYFKPRRSCHFSSISILDAPQKFPVQVHRGGIAVRGRRKKN
jgi:hypothetical protein